MLSLQSFLLEGRVVGPCWEKFKPKGPKGDAGAISRGLVLCHGHVRPACGRLGGVGGGGTGGVRRRGSWGRAVRSAGVTHPRPFVGVSQKSIFNRPCQFLAINAHKMAPRPHQRLQDRTWDTPTWGLLWGGNGPGSGEPSSNGTGRAEWWTYHQQPEVNYLPRLAPQLISLER